MLRRAAVAAGSILRRLPASARSSTPSHHVDSLDRSIGRGPGGAAVLSRGFAQMRRRIPPIRNAEEEKSESSSSEESEEDEEIEEDLDSEESEGSEEWEGFMLDLGEDREEGKKIEDTD